MPLLSLSLVTGGGSGFLGRHLVDQLLAHGQRVRVLSRTAQPDLMAAGVECAIGDLRDQAALLLACEGVDTVYHTAALPGIWGAWDKYHAVNTLGTENLLAASHTQGVARFIYTSSPSVVYDGQPHVRADESLPYPERYLCHYPETKALAERAVLAANCDRLLTVALRPHLIWGPRDNHLIPRLLERAQSGQLRQVGDGTNEISMAYVENVASAHRQVAEALRPRAACAGRAYFINEPEPVRLWDWVNQLIALAGLPPVRKRISSRTAYALGATMEAVYSLFRWESEPRMTRFLAAQLSQSHSYRIDAAMRDWGYQPYVTVAEGMQRIAPELRRLVR